MSLSLAKLLKIQNILKSDFKKLGLDLMSEQADQLILHFILIVMSRNKFVDKS